jgi:hypothetical protein
MATQIVLPLEIAEAFEKIFRAALPGAPQAIVDRYVQDAVISSLQASAAELQRQAGEIANQISTDLAQCRSKSN